MPLSNFPHGFMNGVSVLGMPILNSYVGQLLFVDSSAPGASDQNAGTRQKPLATVKGAITKARSVAFSGNNAVRIILANSHAESFAAATTLSATNGPIEIVGMGSDDDLPTFTLTTAAGATLKLGSAGMKLVNVKIITNFAVTAALTLGAKNCVAERVRIYDGTASMLTAISVAGGGANAADRSRIIGCTVKALGATNHILLGEVDDMIEISDCELIGSASTASIANPTATVMTRLIINRNNIGQTHATGKGIGLVSASTGLTVSNYMSVPTSGNELAGSGMFFVNNRAANTAGSADKAVP